jgi:hypothetical protein
MFHIGALSLTGVRRTPRRRTSLRAAAYRLAFDLLCALAVDRPAHVIPAKPVPGLDRGAGALPIGRSPSTLAGREG